jgi:hypothetical protein
MMIEIDSAQLPNKLFQVEIGSEFIRRVVVCIAERPVPWVTALRNALASRSR